MSPGRLDRLGEPLDEEPLPLAVAGLPVPPLRTETEPVRLPVPARTCVLCGRTLDPGNLSQIDAECRLIIANLLGREIPERWSPADGLEDVIVSDQGRVARLLKIDRSHRYPRISANGRRFYLHHLVAESFHGARSDGAQALYADDDPLNPNASNIRWGTPKENAEGAKRNRASAATGQPGRRNNHERTHITHRRAQPAGPAGGNGTARTTGG